MTIELLADIALALLVAIAPVAVIGCTGDNPEQQPGQDLEEIKPNIVVLALTDRLNPTDTTSARFSDPDGDGGIEPTVDTLTIYANATYSGHISAFFSGQIAGRDTTIDFRPDYIEFSRHHQFFYTPGGAGASRFSVSIDDRDSSNLPLGLEFAITVTSGPPTTASMRVELGHYDDPAQPKDGSRQPYERDIDVVFPVNIR